MKRNNFVELLTNDRADTNLRDHSGRTALSQCAIVGNDAAVPKLLRNGADPLVRDNEDRSPLYLALRNGKDAVVNLLVAELQATYGDRWKQVVQLALGTWEMVQDQIHNLDLDQLLARARLL